MVHKTIFISAFHPFISKNILNAAVLSLLQSQEEVRIVVLVPEGRGTFFNTAYGAPNVIIEEVPVGTAIGSSFVWFATLLSRLFMKSHYLWYKKIEARDARESILLRTKYVLFTLTTTLFGGRKSVRALFRIFYGAVPTHYFEKYFDRYVPTLVFATDIFDVTDAVLLKEAKKRKTRTVGMVRSWDNCYSKGVLKVIPDRVLVNNETLRDEAIELHDVLANSIAVVGLPQFDAFVRDERMPRKAFLDLYRIEHDRRVVLFAPAGNILSDTDTDTCVILEQAMSDGRFVKPVHVFVRNHPHHPADLREFEKKPHFTIESPGHVLNKDDAKAVEFDLEDSKHLADVVFHADVVVYVATSLSLDATVFDKPQIIINFDGFQQKPYLKSVRRYHDEDHMKKLLHTGGVAMVHSADELVGKINDYLEHPEHEREGRKRIEKQQLYALDGKSSERVAHAILQELASATN